MHLTEHFLRWASSWALTYCMFMWLHLHEDGPLSPLLLFFILLIIFTALAITLDWLPMRAIYGALAYPVSYYCFQWFMYGNTFVFTLVVTLALLLALTELHNYLRNLDDISHIK